MTKISTFDQIFEFSGKSVFLSKTYGGQFLTLTSASRRDSFEKFPKTRNRRSKGSGHEIRPSTAGNHGLRTNQNRESSSDEENATEILKRYDEGFRR